MYKQSFFILSTLSLLTACVSTSQVLQMGKDTYSVSATADGFRDAAAARQSAYVQANSKCQALGKNFMFVNESTMATRMGIDTTVNLTFRCLSDNDPQYTRPNIENTPDVLIQNR